MRFSRLTVVLYDLWVSRLLLMTCQAKRQKLQWMSLKRGTGSGERTRGTGKWKIKNKINNYNFQLLIGLGFKWGLVPIFYFQVPRAPFPLPVPRFSNTQHPSYNSLFFLSDKSLSFSLYLGILSYLQVPFSREKQWLTTNLKYAEMCS